MEKVVTICPECNKFPVTAKAFGICNPCLTKKKKDGIIKFSKAKRYRIHGDEIRKYQNKYHIGYYKKNREKLIARQKEYNNRPDVKDKYREYHRKYMAKYYNENRAEWNEYMRKRKAEMRASKKKHWWSKLW
jgi:hypothetical protein